MCLSVSMYDFMWVYVHDFMWMCGCDLWHVLISEISNTHALGTRDGAMILCNDFWT
jgi:hypothetical protein